MIPVVQKIFEQAASRLADRLVAFVPPLLVSIVIVASAWLLAGIVRWVILRAVKAVTLEKFLRETGVSGMLGRSERLRAASLVAGASYWLILGIGLLAALDVFDTRITSRLVETIVFSVPKLAIGGAILLVGFWLAQHWSRGALVWAVNESIPFPRWIAMTVRILVLFVAVVVASDMLGFASTIFFTAFVILLGGVTLALSVAAGLACHGSLERRLAQVAEPLEDCGQTVSHHV